MVDHSVDFFGGVFPKRITKEVMQKYFDYYNITKEADKKKVIQDFRSRGYDVHISMEKKSNPHLDQSWMDKILGK